MNPEPGTYALVLESRTRQKVQIGRWREIEIQPGYYIYIGSAFGPGGVRARVSRHFRLAKSNHWHIDYLRMHTTPLGAWYSHDPLRLEHAWATTLDGLADFTPVHGFGCSDCRCDSHLFHVSKLWSLDRLLRGREGKVNWWPNPTVAQGDESMEMNLKVPGT